MVELSSHPQAGNEAVQPRAVPITRNRTAGKATKASCVVEWMALPEPLTGEIMCSSSEAFLTREVAIPALWSSLQQCLGEVACTRTYRDSRNAV